MQKLQRLYLVRHGETAWSLSGQHTGLTDIPLSPKGEEDIRKLADRLQSTSFARVFTSPLQRARRTSELAVPSAVAEIDSDLTEWDYGDYEGLLTREIHENNPDWNIFRDGCPRGESPTQVTLRANRVIARLRNIEGDIAIFSHGHFGRVLAARWIGLDTEHALNFLLDTASLSILGYGHNSVEEPAVVLWNNLPDGTSGLHASQRIP